MLNFYSKYFNEHILLAHILSIAFNCRYCITSASGCNLCNKDYYYYYYYQRSIIVRFLDYTHKKLVWGQRTVLANTPISVCENFEKV